MASRTSKANQWDLALKRLLPQFGHRNWIVIADSAYPFQSSVGIETIATEADHLEVLRCTLDAIGRTRHVRPNIFVDAELQSVIEQDAPGVTGFRQKLTELIGSRDTHSIPHEQIIAKLDESAKLFRIVIFKSTLVIPYTSVFLELDCGYWTGDAEQRLRQSMTGSERPKRARLSNSQSGKR
jgi:hypothetical protein